MDLDLGYTRKLIAACKAAGYLRNQTAYLLATAYWETGRTMLPVREAYYLGAGAEAWRKAHLRYYPFYGRGFVQLTWQANYAWGQQITGKPMVSAPDLALDADDATMIIVEGMRIGKFTGKKLSDYVDLQHSDFTNARRVINGTDKAADIAVIAQHYDDALKAVWVDMPAPKPVVVQAALPTGTTPLTDPGAVISDPPPQTAQPAAPPPIILPPAPSVTVIEQKSDGKPVVTQVQTPAQNPVKPTVPQTKAGWGLLGIIIAAILSVFAKLHYGG